jgi:hypothetical protein
MEFKSIKNNNLLFISIFKFCVITKLFVKDIPYLSSPITNYGLLYNNKLINDLLFCLFVLVHFIHWRIHYLLIQNWLL